MNYITIKEREILNCKNKDGSDNIIYKITFKKGDVQETVNIKCVTDTGDENIKNLEKQARQKFKIYIKALEEQELEVKSNN